MKRNVAGMILAGIFCLAVLATAFLAFHYVRSARELQKLQHQASVVNLNRTRMNALAAEALEYSKRNPAIDEVLQSIGWKQRGRAMQSVPSSTNATIEP